MDAGPHQFAERAGGHAPAAGEAAHFAPRSRTRRGVCRGAVTPRRAQSEPGPPGAAPGVVARGGREGLAGPPPHERCIVACGNAEDAVGEVAGLTGLRRDLGVEHGRLVDAVERSTKNMPAGV